MDENNRNPWLGFGHSRLPSLPFLYGVHTSTHLYEVSHFILHPISKKACKLEQNKKTKENSPTHQLTNHHLLPPACELTYHLFTTYHPFIPPHKIPPPSHIIRSIHPKPSTLFRTGRKYLSTLIQHQISSP